MTNAEVPPDPLPKKKSKLPLLLGLIGALTLGGGAFFAVYSGLILNAASPAAAKNSDTDALPKIAFVAVDPITISLGPHSSARHLRFASQLEVGPEHANEVALLLPRITDVLNSYLRAVDIAQLQDPSALMRLKAQMLRRIQIVTGQDRVRDLLISEFILN